MWVAVKQLCVSSLFSPLPHQGRLLLLLEAGRPMGFWIILPLPLLLLQRHWDYRRVLPHPAFCVGSRGQTWAGWIQWQALTCRAISLVPDVCFEGGMYELIEDMQRIESKQGEQKFQSAGRKGVGGRANTWAFYSNSLGIVSLPSQMDAEHSLSGK